MKYAIYRRVSTVKQGMSGLGLEAQQHAVETFLAARGGEVVGEFVEVESGKNNLRPKLSEAIAMCKSKNATLLIAKLDRLARKVSFIFGLRDSGVKFVAADMPEANTLTIGVLVCMAQYEAELISQRTREGLAMARRRGKKLGNPRPDIAKMVQARKDKAARFRLEIAPTIQELRQANVQTLHGIAHCLNVRGFKTSTGKSFLPQTISALG